MDRSGVKKISLIRGGFCHQNQSCLKLPKMDRSGVKKNFPHQGGGFSATKTKVAWNCLKWIDLVSKNFPSSRGGWLFCQKIQSCSKLPEMDRSGVKNISFLLGGGAFCHPNQSCLKLPEMDRCGVKKLSLILGGGGAFLPPKPKLLKIAWNG